MDNLVLVTRPKHDDGSEYLSAYASEILKKFGDGISFKDFSGKDANKQNVEKYLRRKSPRLLFLNGHGNESVICGHKDEIIFSSDNVDLLKNKITYARACFSANILGRESVEDNGGCFIGYVYPFSFWTDGKRSATPLKDNVASIFLSPSNEVVVSLLKGNSAKEADKKSRDMMISNMKKILVMEQKNEPSATGMLQVLWGNYEGQVVLGNEDAKLT
ncbi:MAG: hypothetical protein ABIB79_03725 [archaeon]